MRQTEDTITCAKCAADVHWLEVFPGGICLACHAHKTEHLTPQELLDQIMTGFKAINTKKGKK